MQAADILSLTIQPLNPKDPVARALDLMDEFGIRMLPVVARNRLVGLVKEEAVMNSTDPLTTVDKLMDSVELPYVRDRQHVYDVLKLMSERDLPLVPVLDMNGRYVGVVSEHEATRHLADLVNACVPGSVVVLEMGRNEYSLQQIARIVEEEGARILSMYCTDNPDSMLMQVTLKINQGDISGILQAFDRFEYSVHTTFQGSKMDENLRERFDDLMRIIKL